ncbi:helix-turn-helix domain-containing protein [Nocardia sp. SYP-A9097]|uniref:AraC family transcriptional regulator n=1 Tax=Nocardia sp. SYP-A9097 TaxID=2663237 RepID=UPI00129BC18E|nr:AraC family transcriptional regulator [Nocardia sp. SYP-A9097]MRH90360.1 helix-turn-helix domain-containing protein [Nocardia sp. SYP-A9097]
MTDGQAQLRSITSAALLVEFASGRGTPTPALLRGTGIREGDLLDATAEITLGQELALMRNVVAGVGDEPGMGLMAGLLCHPPSLGVLGFALMSCPTVRDAVRLALRYADLSFTVARHHLVVDGPDVSIVRDDSEVPREVRRFAVERDVAAIWTIQQDVLPMRPPITRVVVAFPPHAVYEMFGAMLGVEEVVFNAARSVVTGPADIQSLQLPQSNSATARFYEQQCADLMQRRRSRVGISGRVRQLLISRGGIADQSRIAAELDLSVRTLRRRLADEGTTFRELTTETIGMLAEELLITGLTVEQAAIRLGYASVSAFTSAFRAWKGQSPGVFARENRGRVSARVS